MADPFEVRMRFSHQLQHLNASVTSAQKAAQYALKNKDMDEDLHSCILEQLEKNSMNTRANIMYFIEHFLEMASKERHDTYVRMIQRDIIRVVDAVCPEDGSGAANVKVVRRVLQGLQNKCFLLEQTVSEIDALLKERDASHNDLLSSPPEGAPAENNGTQSASQSASRNGSTSVRRLDKRQIEQRIEEDRERHKRLRESIWAVPSGTTAEMWRIWDETSDLGEDDHILGEEEWAEHEKSIEALACVHRKEAAHKNRASNGDIAH